MEGEAGDLLDSLSLKTWENCLSVCGLGKKFYDHSKAGVGKIFFFVKGKSKSLNV